MSKFDELINCENFLAPNRNIPITAQYVPSKTIPFEGMVIKQFKQS